MNDIGKNIRSLRKAGNLTQDELAEKLHVTRQTISNYENGKSEPDLEMLGLIVETFGTDITGLIYGKKEESSSAYRTLLTAAVFLGFLGILAAMQSRILLDAGRQYFILPYAAYVLRFGILPYVFWTVAFLMGFLLQKTVRFSSRTARACFIAASISAAAVMVLYCAGMYYVQIYDAVETGSTVVYGGTAPEWMNILTTFVTGRNSGWFVLCAAVLGLGTGITSPAAQKEPAQASTGKIRRMAVGMVLLPVWFICLFWFKYQSPFVIARQTEDYRMTYRIPAREAVVSYYSVENGETTVSHRFIEAQQFTYIDLTLPKHRNKAWYRKTHAEYHRETIQNTEQYTLLHGRRILLLSNEEQILCIDGDHSFSDMPDSGSTMYCITIRKP